jgi:hypothetical protein
MAIRTTPEGFSQFLKQLGDIATVQAPRIEQTALLAGIGAYKRRIFNSGKDTQEQPIGKKAKKRKGDQFVGDYTRNYYESVRRPRGAGSKKNINIDGGTVRNLIQVGRSGNTNVFGFVNERTSEIGVGQEEIHAKKIFTPSTAESDLMIDEYVEEVFDLIRTNLNRLPRV